MAVELWLVWERFVAVRQVMDWRGSQGDASSGTVMSGAEWSGSQGFAGHVTVERGEAGQSTVGQGSRGLARRGEVQYVAAKSRNGGSCQGSHGELSQGGAMPVMDWRGSHGGAG